MLIYEQKSVSRGATFTNPHFKKAALISQTRAEEARVQIENEVRAQLQRTQVTQDSEEDTPRPYAGLLSFLNEIVDDSRRSTTSTADAAILVRQYVELLPIDNKLNPITYWSNADTQVQALAAVAEYYLCVPATSVHSERLFSEAGYLSSERRNSLPPFKTKMLVFLHGNDKFV